MRSRMKREWGTSKAVKRDVIAGDAAVKGFTASSGAAGLI